MDNISLGSVNEYTCGLVLYSSSEKDAWTDGKVAGSKKEMWSERRTDGWRDECTDG